jgi:hypothetical protein
MSQKKSIGKAAAEFNARGQKSADKSVSGTSSSRIESELDIFVYSTDRVDSVRFNKAKRKFTDYICSRYPDVGHIFTHNEEMNYPELNPPAAEEFDIENDPMGFKKEIFRERIKAYVRRINEYDTNKRLVYGLLWKQCTQSLQNAIRQDPRYIEIEDEFAPPPFIPPHCHIVAKYRHGILLFVDNSLENVA